MKIFIACVFAALALMAYGQELQQETDNQTDSLAGCDVQACMRACMAFGWAGGRCQGNNCVCFRFYRSENRLENFSNKELFVSADEEAAACDSSRCRRACVAYGCLSGSCFGNNCKCSGCR